MHLSIYIFFLCVVHLVLPYIIPKELFIIIYKLLIINIGLEELFNDKSSTSITRSRMDTDKGKDRVVNEPVEQRSPNLNNPVEQTRPDVNEAESSNRGGANKSGPSKRPDINNPVEQRRNYVDSVWELRDQTLVYNREGTNQPTAGLIAQALEDTRARYKTRLSQKMIPRNMDK